MFSAEHKISCIVMELWLWEINARHSLSRTNYSMKIINCSNRFLLRGCRITEHRDRVGSTSVSNSRGLGSKFRSIFRLS
jgi:hypothetical protein